MALTRLARLSAANDPLLQLGKVISDLLPHQGLSLIDKVRRWSDRLLILAALMMCWASGSSLMDRLGLACGRHSTFADEACVAPAGVWHL